MNNDQLIEKLITNTQEDKQIWNVVGRIPSCIVIVYEECTKIFSTNITNDLTLYIIEYSYLKYFPDFDSYRPRYSIYTSVVKNNIEVDGFDQSTLYNPSKMEDLRDLIIKKIFNPDKDIENFIDS